MNKTHIYICGILCFTSDYNYHQHHQYWQLILKYRLYMEEQN